MAEIELVKRVKYAGDVFDALVNQAEWDIDTAAAFLERIPDADVVPVVRCRECKHRNKQKCPLVMVRFDMKPNGKIKKVLEQNYVDEEFWCKDGARMDGE